MRNLVLVSAVLLATVAYAEGAERKHAAPDTADKLSNVVTMMHMGRGGLVTLGGSSLRVLAPGKKKFDVLHRVPGDDLYRATATDDGAILAAWEKEPVIHYFSAAPRTHVTFPKPSAPDGIRLFNVDHLAFHPNGRDAVVHMQGVWAPYSRQGFHAVYRIALDGKSAPELLYKVDSGLKLYSSSYIGVHVVPRDPNQDCEHRTCDPVASIDVYEVTSNGVKKTTLMDGSDGSITNARMIWGEPSNLLVLSVHRSDRTRQILRWRPGDPKPTLRPLTGRQSGMEELFTTATGEVLQLIRDHGKELRIRRLFPDGTEKSFAVPASQDRERWDQEVYDVGIRANGRLYIHWGDQLLLFSKDMEQPPRAYDLEPYRARKTTWAGAGVYLEKPESLWLGLENRGGRDFVRVDFAKAEKLARPWPWTSAKPDARAGKGSP